MKIKGIIFDFNGTLFWDTEYQNIAWEEYLKSHGINLTENEKKEYLHGRNVRDTFEYLFDKKMSDDEVEVLSEQKEIIYRSICIQNKMELAPGAEVLFQYLLDRNIKIGIATAAGKSNVDFFIEKFGLLNYFSAENIIYNDGSIRGKPYPDLFNKAMNALNIDHKAVIIFEDSHSGIKAAENARPHQVIIVNSTNENYSRFPHQIITHFDQFDRSILEAE